MVKEIEDLNNDSETNHQNAMIFQERPKIVKVGIMSFTNRNAVGLTKGFKGEIFAAA